MARDGEIVAAKRLLFQGGDPDAHEFPQFTDFAVLQFPNSPPQPGIVRILCNLATSRHRVLMRSADTRVVLLNHYLLPGLTLGLSDTSATYSAEDFAGAPRKLTIRLTFQTSSARNYFHLQFGNGVTTNESRIDDSLMASLEFPPTSPLRGIIAHLTERFGGNVDDAGAVRITGTGSFSRRHDMWSSPDAKNAADLTTDTIFRSDEEGSRWLCYDFLDRRVQITHYAIESHSSGALVGCNHMKSWVVEGVADAGDEWAEIDRRQDDISLKDFRAVRIFEVAATREIRMVRIKQTGPNHTGMNELIVSAWEIFGALME
jgi:hypothetical protein